MLIWLYLLLLFLVWTSLYVIHNQKHLNNFPFIKSTASTSILMIKNIKGKLGCFIEVADKNHNFKRWGMSLNWHQFERNAQLDRVLSLLLYSWWRAQKPAVIGISACCAEKHTSITGDRTRLCRHAWNLSHWNSYITAAQAQLTCKTPVGFSSATRVLYS